MARRLPLSCAPYPYLADVMPDGSEGGTSGGCPTEKLPQGRHPSHSAEGRPKLLINSER